MFGKKSGKNVFSHSQLSIAQSNVHTRARSIRFIIKTLQLIKLQLQIVTLKEEDKSLCWHSDCCYIDATLLPYQIRSDFFSRWCECKTVFSAVHYYLYVCTECVARMALQLLLGVILAKGLQKQPSMSKQLGIFLLIPFIS